MPRDDLLDLEGVVTDSKGGGKYEITVQSENEETPTILGQLSGHLRRHHIRVLPGDTVVVSVSPYDLSHGLITYRGPLSKKNKSRH